MCLALLPPLLLWLRQAHTPCQEAARLYEHPATQGHAPASLTGLFPLQNLVPPSLASPTLIPEPGDLTSFSTYTSEPTGGDRLVFQTRFLSLSFTPTLICPMPT